ncbi:hypothetical protein AIN02nite_28760 [Acetobacter indonesiensis]|uniref:Uncharacterized protein n=1 Tax=Acetobacter indonesiensis TaxID=104101 RepID=A0A6N3T6B1_9PROT|nr:hypothetical protein Abin_003_001 [Acetobacter indonesiensis]GEN04851.1 hypothetical protein AIN02nite_28760 [Acetobacter indonesiensis]
MSAQTLEAVLVLFSSPSRNRAPSLAAASVVFHFRLNRNFRSMETWDLYERSPEARYPTAIE